MGGGLLKKKKKFEKWGRSLGGNYKLMEGVGFFFFFLLSETVRFTSNKLNGIISEAHLLSLSELDVLDVSRN